MAGQGGNGKFSKAPYKPAPSAATASCGSRVSEPQTMGNDAVAQALMQGALLGDAAPASSPTLAMRQVGIQSLPSVSRSELSTRENQDRRNEAASVKRGGDLL